MVEEAVKEALPTEEEQQPLQIGSEVQGTVDFLAAYGAMVDIGAERPALLHISQIGRNDFRDIEEVYNVGETITAYVLKIDKEDRIALTLEKPPALPWNRIKKDETYPGTVTRIENYGAFVDIGAERDGMVHVSELADGYVQSPNDVVSIGQEVEVRVIKLNRKNRQIDLSMKTPEEEIQEILEPDTHVPSAMEMAFRRAQEDEDTRRDRRNNKKKKGRRNWDDREDIIERTLRNHRD